MITPRQLRRGLWAATGVAVLMLGTALPRGTSPPGPPRSADPPLADAADWRLNDHQGHPFTAAELATGKPTLVVFGFTQCPDVCPTSLSYVADVLKRLGPQGHAIRSVFLTVDPDRDSTAILADYVSVFDPRIRGVTGSAGEVAKALRDLGAFSRKVPRDGGDYGMDHTASMLLLDAGGRFHGTLDIHEKPETAVAKIRLVLTDGAHPS